MLPWFVIWVMNYRQRHSYTPRGRLKENQHWGIHSKISCDNFSHICVFILKCQSLLLQFAVLEPIQLDQEHQPLNSQLSLRQKNHWDVCFTPNRGSLQQCVYHYVVVGQHHVSTGSCMGSCLRRSPRHDPINPMESQQADFPWCSLPAWGAPKKVRAFCLFPATQASGGTVGNPLNWEFRPLALIALLSASRLPTGVRNSREGDFVCLRTRGTLSRSNN